MKRPSIILSFLLASRLLLLAYSFRSLPSVTRTHHLSRHVLRPLSQSTNTDDSKAPSIWEDWAKIFHAGDLSSPEVMKQYAQTVTILRVGIPSLFYAVSANVAYPYVAIELANRINDSGVFAVVSQDSPFLAQCFPS
jgi:hypothetical protein